MRAIEFVDSFTPDVLHEIDRIFGIAQALGVEEAKLGAKTANMGTEQQE